MRYGSRRPNTAASASSAPLAGAHADAERTRGNILAALRAGIITPSTRAELIAAEDAVSAATRAIDAARAVQPAQILPRARERWRAIVASLADHARDIPAAREALRALLGDRIPVHEKAGDLIAEIAGPEESQLKLVAGACSAHYLTVPARVYLRCES